MVCFVSAFACFSETAASKPSLGREFDKERQSAGLSNKQQALRVAKRHPVKRPPWSLYRFS